MSHDVFPESASNSETRIRRLKQIISRRMIDHLVSLAPFEDDPGVTVKANKIIEELKELSLPAEQLNQFEQLAGFYEQLPEEDPAKLHLVSVIDDTAEFVLKEIQDCAPSKKGTICNIVSAWNAISAWESAPSDQTYELCETVLRGFWGSGRAQLMDALVLADTSGTSFERALSTINQRESQMVA